MLNESYYAHFISILFCCSFERRVDALEINILKRFIFLNEMLFELDSELLTL